MADKASEPNAARGVKQRRDSIEWLETMIEFSPLTDCKPMLAQIAEELRQLRSALQTMIEPFALTSDAVLRQYPDVPQPTAVLAARAALRVTMP